MSKCNFLYLFPPALFWRVSDDTVDFFSGGYGRDVATCNGRKFIDFRRFLFDFCCCSNGDITYTLRLSKRYGKNKERLIHVENGTMTWDESTSRYEIIGLDSNMIDDETGFSVSETIWYASTTPSRLTVKCEVGVDEIEFPSDFSPLYQLWLEVEGHASRWKDPHNPTHEHWENFYFNFPNLMTPRLNVNYELITEEVDLPESETHGFNNYWLFQLPGGSQLVSFEFSGILQGTHHFITRVYLREIRDGRFNGIEYDLPYKF